MAPGDQFKGQNGVQAALGGWFEAQIGVQEALEGQFGRPSGVQVGIEVRFEGVKWRLEGGLEAKLGLEGAQVALWIFRAGPRP